MVLDLQLRVMGYDNGDKFYPLQEIWDAYMADAQYDFQSVDAIDAESIGIAWETYVSTAHYAGQ